MDEFCLDIALKCFVRVCFERIELNQRMDTLGSQTIAGSSLNSVR